MPVTATNENMDVDSDNNIGEASTTNWPTNATPSTSNPGPSKSNTDTAPIDSVMASTSTVPSVTVSLHPLVIMNISEHWTRIRAQNGAPQQGNFSVNLFIFFIKLNILDRVGFLLYNGYDFFSPNFLLIHFFTVIGALIGKQSGRNVEVMNSFELKFKVVNEDVIICQDYYRTKEEQCKYLFRNYYSRV